ncbi:hypothetical protein IPA_06835 [Ignicoccus pacificus DSM 13166]|uniref:Uncharacterized protein n=1 Tax=Ignicoccus pacificus DSM 13166 TaxID=940294 RepID=A0A977KCS2_9CREN|nr:hypothetical protein IPA_06835 [Ignicoccus pacificus DSM 13166]
MVSFSSSLSSFLISLWGRVRINFLVDLPNVLNAIEDPSTALQVLEELGKYGRVIVVYSKRNNRVPFLKEVKEKMKVSEIIELDGDSGSNEVDEAIELLFYNLEGFNLILSNDKFGRLGKGEILRYHSIRIARTLGKLELVPSKEMEKIVKDCSEWPPSTWPSEVLDILKKLCKRLGAPRTSIVLRYTKGRDVKLFFTKINSLSQLKGLAREYSFPEGRFEAVRVPEGWEKAVELGDWELLGKKVFFHITEIKLALVRSENLKAVPVLIDPTLMMFLNVLSSELVEGKDVVEVGSKVMRRLSFPLDSIKGKEVVHPPLKDSKQMLAIRDEELPEVQNMVARWAREDPSKVTFLGSPLKQYFLMPYAYLWVRRGDEIAVVVSDIWRMYLGERPRILVPRLSKLRVVSKGRNFSLIELGIRARRRPPVLPRDRHLRAPSLRGTELSVRCSG